MLLFLAAASAPDRGLEAPLGLSFIHRTSVFCKDLHSFSLFLIGFLTMKNIRDALAASLLSLYFAIATEYRKSFNTTQPVNLELIRQAKQILLNIHA
jgi:hypothetical protein